MARKILFAICLLVLSGGCHYIGFTAGPDSEYGSAHNFTIEYAGRMPGVSDPPRSRSGTSADPCSVPSKRDFMLSGGVFYIDNGLDLWWYKGDPEMGSFIKLGVEAVPDSGFFINGLMGVSWIRWSTYWDEGTERFGLLGGGVTYFIDDEDACIIVSYDNRRLFNAGLGVRF